MIPLHHRISLFPLVAPPQQQKQHSQVQKLISFTTVGRLMPKTLKRKMEDSENAEKNDPRTPLSVVVSDCVKRWFQDTLAEAKDGDVSMQVLLGQMYNYGYGVPKDPRKARIWLSRVSRTRSSVWKVSKKRPGYNASDSDSDDQEEDEDEDEDSR